MSNKALNYYEFTAPEYMLSEMGDKWDRIKMYTHLDEKDLDDVYSFIKKQISIASLCLIDAVLHKVNAVRVCGIYAF